MAVDAVVSALIVVAVPTLPVVYYLLRLRALNYLKRLPPPWRTPGAYLGALPLGVAWAGICVWQAGERLGGLDGGPTHSQLTLIAVLAFAVGGLTGLPLLDVLRRAGKLTGLFTVLSYLLAVPVAGVYAFIAFLVMGTIVEGFSIRTLGGGFFSDVISVAVAIWTTGILWVATLGMGSTVDPDPAAHAQRWALRERYSKGEIREEELMAGFGLSPGLEPSASQVVPPADIAVQGTGALPSVKRSSPGQMWTVFDGFRSTPPDELESKASSSLEQLLKALLQATGTTAGAVEVPMTEPVRRALRRPDYYAWTVVGVMAAIFGPIAVYAMLSGWLGVLFALIPGGLVTFVFVCQWYRQTWRLADAAEQSFLRGIGVGQFVRKALQSDSPDMPKDATVGYLYYVRVGGIKLRIPHARYLEPSLRSKLDAKGYLTLGDLPVSVDFTKRERLVLEVRDAEGKPLYRHPGYNPDIA